MKFLGTHRGLRISILYKKTGQLSMRAAAENAPRRRRYFIFPRSRNAVKVALAEKKKREYPETENSAR